MDDRDESVIQQVTSVCNTHGWNVETASGDLPMTLTSPDGEHEISVHRSPVTEGRLLVAELMSENDRMRDERGDVIVKRVRLWIENR